MVIDTSALLAILFDEPERRAFERAIEMDSRRLVSAMTLFEGGHGDDWSPRSPGCGSPRSFDPCDQSDGRTVRRTPR
jgi:hypothetical protein